MKTDISIKTDKFDIFLCDSYREITHIKLKKFGGRYNQTLEDLSFWSVVNQWARQQGYRGVNIKQEGRNGKNYLLLCSSLL
jgi:hypothetical protein